MNIKHCCILLAAALLFLNGFLALSTNGQEHATTPSHGPKAGRVLTITYRNENYRVPQNEIWKLTWKSPYMKGEIRNAYDVRVIGNCYTSSDLGTSIAAYSTKPGERGSVDITAGGSPAVIWIPSGREFYLANDLIQVHVEVFDTNTLKRSNKE